MTAWFTSEVVIDCNVFFSTHGLSYILHHHSGGKEEREGGARAGRDRGRQERHVERVRNGVSER